MNRGERRIMSLMMGCWVQCVCKVTRVQAAEAVHNNARELAWVDEWQLTLPKLSEGSSFSCHVLCTQHHYREWFTRKSILDLRICWLTSQWAGKGFYKPCMISMEEGNKFLVWSLSWRSSSWSHCSFTSFIAISNTPISVGQVHFCVGYERGNVYTQFRLALSA